MKLPKYLCLCDICLYFKQKSIVKWIYLTNMLSWGRKHNREQWWWW